MNRGSRRPPAFSRERLKRMRATLQSHVDGGELPGMVTLIHRRGETVTEAYGTSAIGSRAPLKEDAIFRIASMTKPVTAVATLILLEECRLRLDDPVERWCPELAGRRVLKRLDGPVTETEPARRPITVRDLLTFRMGFGMILGSREQYPILQAFDDLGITGLWAPDPSASKNVDEWLGAFATLPLMAQPGERWLYNTAYYVLGALLTRVARCTLEELFQDRIFGPLGMRDTSFSVPSSKLSRLSSSYYFDDEKGCLSLYDGPGNSLWSKPPAFEDAAACLVSTASDFAAFSEMLLSGGTRRGKRILSPASVAAMTTNQLTSAQRALGGFFPDQWEKAGYGYGVGIALERGDPTTTPGQYGWDGGLGSSWRIDPHEAMFGMIFCERTFDSPALPPVCQDFWTCAYAAI